MYALRLGVVLVGTASRSEAIGLMVEVLHAASNLLAPV